MLWNCSPQPEKAYKDSGNCSEGLPWQGLHQNANISDSQKAKEGVTGGVADQRHLNPKVFIADIAAEVENDRLESARKLSQIHGMTITVIHATLHRIWSSPRGRLCGCLICQKRRRRRSACEWPRQLWQWSLPLLDHLRQRSHWWWVGKGEEGAGLPHLETVKEAQKLLVVPTIR